MKSLHQWLFGEIRGKRVVDHQIYANAEWFHWTQWIKPGTVASCDYAGGMVNRVKWWWGNKTHQMRVAYEFGGTLTDMRLNRDGTYSTARKPYWKYPGNFK